MSDFMTPDITMSLATATSANAARGAQDIKNAKDMERIEQTAQEFESVFLSEMLKPMFEGIQVEAPFGGGKGEEVFRGFMLQEYGKMIAQSGGIGIADHVKAEMIRMQENLDAKTSHTTQ